MGDKKYLKAWDQPAIQINSTGTYRLLNSWRAQSIIAHTSNTMLPTLPNELLLEIAEYLPNTSDVYCMLMTTKDLSTLLQPLLEKAAQKIQDTAKGKNLPLIHFAAFEDDISIAKLALKLDPSSINLSFSFSGTPLRIASWKSFPKLVDFLIANGANPNGKDPFDLLADTPLNQALRNIIRREPGSAAMMIRRKQVIEQLLQAGGNPDIKGRNGLNALLQAATKGIAELITSIVKTGMVDINTRSPNQSTALHAAVTETGPGTDEVIEELLKQGIDVNAVNIYGQTALFNSCTPSGTALLIKYGADINIVDFSKQTVLHHKAKCVNHNYAAAIISEILRSEMPIDVNLLDNLGRSALDYARYTHNEPVVRLLEQFQASSLCKLRS